MSQLAALGLFAFQLETAPIDGIARRADWKHARAARVGARDAFQFVGPGDESVRVGGTIAPGTVGKFSSIETLRSMAATGDTYQFVRGDGRVLGSFVILSLDDEGKYLTVDGVPMKVDFVLELARVD